MADDADAIKKQLDALVSEMSGAASSAESSAASAQEDAEAAARVLAERKAAEVVAPPAAPAPVVEQVPPGPELGAAVAALKDSDRKFVAMVPNAFLGKPAGAWVGRGDIVGVLSNKGSVADRVIRALVKDGVLEQKPGINEYRMVAGADLSGAEALPQVEEKIATPADAEAAAFAIIQAGDALSVPRLDSTLKKSGLKPKGTTGQFSELTKRWLAAGVLIAAGTSSYKMTPEAQGATSFEEAVAKIAQVQGAEKKDDEAEKKRAAALAAAAAGKPKGKEDSVVKDDAVVVEKPPTHPIDPLVDIKIDSIEPPPSVPVKTPKPADKPARPAEQVTPPFDIEKTRAAGQKLSDLYDGFYQLLNKAEKRGGLPPNQWKAIYEGITTFLAQVKILEDLKLPFSPEVLAARTALQSTIRGNRVEKPEVARKAVDDLANLLRDTFRSAIGSGEQVKPAPQFVSGGFDLGGTSSPDNSTETVGATATPAAFMAAAAAVGKPKTPVTKPERPVPIDITFANLDKVKMVDAFSNDVFDSFFRKFDSARNGGAEEFDAANPDHHERYEKALEAYALWREAIGVFSKQAEQLIEADFGIKPAKEDMVVFEDEIEGWIMEDPPKVRQMIDQIKLYQTTEDGEKAKEKEIAELGGLEKLRTQVDELDLLRQEKKRDADTLIGALNVISKQRNTEARAWEVKNRTWYQRTPPSAAEKKDWVGFRKVGRQMADATVSTNRGASSFFDSIGDRISGAAAGGSFKDRLKGLVRGKAAVDLEKELQDSGTSIDAAAAAFPATLKRERAFEQQAAAAIREYEKIETKYMNLKSKANLVERAAQEKQQLTDQFAQLRFRIYSDTEAFKTVARLTAGRSRDAIKGMLDPAVATDDKLPAAAQKAEQQLARLRKAADFQFSKGRYAGVPEIAESLTDEGEIIVEADEAITEAVRKQIQTSIEKFTVVDSKNTALIQKTLLGYGKRGYDLSEKILSEAIVKAKAAKEDRRANVLQALLFEMRALSS